MDYSGWNVLETQFDPGELHHKETLFTLGNGYLGTRGSFEEGYPNASAATMINGVYDDVPVMHTELVNCPDWLPLTVYIGSDRFCLSQGEILDYQRQLDLRWGIVSRDVLWRSPSGHTIKFHFERMISMADDHVLVLHCQITPLDFTGAIAVEASINGNVDNHGVKHWDWLEQGGSNHNAWLRQRCSHSKIELGMAFQLACSEATPVKFTGDPGSPTLTTVFQAQPGKTVTFEKIVTVFTSLEVTQTVSAAQERLASLPSYTTLLAAHGAVWNDLWQDCDIVIEGDSTAQIAVRYNLFQLLAAAPRHNNRVSIPAKTLSGFAYRGHVFWDTEVFIVPFFTFTQPQIARNLLSYRYHTLEGARRKAQASGYEGAMFAWESANTGDEVTPRWVFGPDGEPVRIWCGDIEVHINTDIAYAVWHYWQATGDDDWLQREGAEIILDTAVFWGSRVEWNGDRQCYEIRDVIGPDENHERVDNNTFTNRMAQWHLETALTVYKWLQQHHPERAAELAQKLDIRPERTKRWSHIIRHMLVPQPTDTAVIEQFEGFFNLEDIDWTDYQWRTQSMQAILGVEGTNEKQILKQPDILMLLYLLRDQPLTTEITAQQRRQLLEANWNYYTPRTDHTYGSSLGPAIHAILACELDEPATAYEHFMRAALVDIKDVRGNAGEGVHAASAGGVWQATIFGFAGVRLTEAGPIVNQSHLPSDWTRLHFKLQWRQQCYNFDISPDAVIMTTHKPEASGISSKKLNQVKPRTLSDRCPITPLRGVIFDLDGVLTDTSEYHYLAWKQLADEIGIAFDRQANEQMRGLSRRDSLLHMLGDRAVSEAELQEMMNRKNSYYEQLIQNLTPADLLPGALEILDELQAADIKVAIGSSSKNARLVCQRLGIAERLNAIADGYSVERHKPAPDVFLFAAQQLGLQPHECLVVEDASSGVAAGLAAEMWVLGLGPVERVGDAHLVRDSLAGLQWQQLLIDLEKSQMLVCSD